MIATVPPPLSSTDTPVPLRWWRRWYCKTAGVIVLALAAYAVLASLFDGQRHLRIERDKLTVSVVTRGTFHDFIPLRARIVPRDTIYLDAIEGIFADKQSVRVEALRGDRAAIEFRGLPPSARDQLVKEAGKDIVVQDSDWNCGNILTPNHKKKPFDDVRVRKALLMAIDRWGGSQGLSRISTLRSVGGVLRPGSPLATPDAELEKLPGFSRNMAAARAEAKKLLAEAGVPNLKLTLWNRNLAMPYTPAGIFLVDQWRQIGVQVEHKQSDTSPYIAAMSSGNFDVAIDFSNLFMDDSTLALAKFLSGSAQNMSKSKDPELDKLYDQHVRERDPEKRKALIRAFEKRLFEQGYQQPLLWWHRIVPSHKVVMGWKMSPSHNLGAQLEDVWLNQ